MTKPKLLLLLTATLALSPALAQTAPSTTPPIPFEAATITPDKDARGWNLFATPDGYIGEGVSLRQLIHEAYGVYDDKLLIGGPSWIDSAKFDLVAKFNAADIPNAKALTFRQRAAMLQPLLADRFQLKLHHESKPFPVFNLVVARSGPKLQPIKPEDLQHGCLVTRSQAGIWSSQACPVSSLLALLRANTGRTVLDQTGLPGLYNIDLHWTPGNAPPSAATDTSGPSIFTAVQEQLGLKLEPATAPLDILVIDSAQSPSDN
jgi:uncharacterized protein (TIGR03435 family)